MGLLATAGNAAKQSFWAELHKQHLPLHWIGLGMLIALVVTWLIFRWRNSRLKRRLNSPRQLLRDLFRLHEISWSDRRLMLQAARRQKISEPARLFIEPQLWQQLIDAEKSRAVCRRLAILQKKLL